MKKILYPLSLRLLSERLPYLKELQDAEKLSEHDVSALTQMRLERLLSHAHRHVPYYRRVLEEAGVADGSGVIDTGRFAELPLLDKGTIHNRTSELKSDDLDQRKWFNNSSGGSTGEPVPLVQDNEYNDWVGAVKLLFDLWSDYAPGDPKVLLWGSDRDLFVGRQTVKIRLRRWVKNEIWLNTFRMTPEQMRLYIQKINEFRPVQILAYAESAYGLARFVESEGLRIHSPKAIMTSTGTLYPHMRQTIERVFQSPVFNRYGSREAGDMACECEAHEGLHVSPLTHLIEILRPDGSAAPPGETGEIVVTVLRNYSMPLIRYRIGDMGTWAGGACPCGRNWPFMKEITGRVSDIFVTSNGTQVHGAYFPLLFFFDWITKFQVVQEDYDHVVVNLVTKHEEDDPRTAHSADLDEIAWKIRAAMGEDCRVDFEFHDDIKPTASGKFRYLISKINRET